jgi:hypothetical protein
MQAERANAAAQAGLGAVEERVRRLQSVKAEQAKVFEAIRAQHARVQQLEAANRHRVTLVSALAQWLATCCE